ncbi:predicted protein [Nematostella vectensis]|uniref:Uncharacterized protein n=1 Tax=Nematostella vectensis TaxID=45351 RepID=A7SSK2_NEMVE|nr:predicted protein [Nematostella vectensis]|eukprot:XP_001625418.1 predicted protein [Nematostella vectensis]
MLKSITLAKSAQFKRELMRTYSKTAIKPNKLIRSVRLAILQHIKWTTVDKRAAIPDITMETLVVIAGSQGLQVTKTFCHGTVFLSQSNGAAHYKHYVFCLLRLTSILFHVDSVLIACHWHVVKMSSRMYCLQAESFVRMFQSKLYIESLIQGNVTSEEAIALQEVIYSKLQMIPLSFLPEIRVVQLLVTWCYYTSARKYTVLIGAFSGVVQIRVVQLLFTWCYYTSARKYLCYTVLIGAFCGVVQIRVIQLLVTWCYYSSARKYRISSPSWAIVEDFKKS